jgi:ferrochelatase
MTAEGMTMTHTENPRIGVLMAQLGTPDAPTADALRPYLRQFLSDRRVIDYAPLIWQPILRGIILRTRPRRSARLYGRIWLDQGSPLLHYSRLQVEGLQNLLGGDYRVMLGMRYGQPSIPDALRQLEAEGITRIVVLSMFPQYSSTTTAALYDAVFEAASGRPGTRGATRKRFVPALRFVPPYYDDPRYIDALAARLNDTIASLDHAPDHIVVTFHGIPNRYVRTGDPYRAQCEATADHLAAVMNWRADQWTLSFQSQFGPEKWLEPYTEDVLKGLHTRGIEAPLVFSPGFTADCLETLDELGNEGREQFEDGGGHGDHYRLAACLNDHPRWLAAMADLVRENAAGWIGRESRPVNTLRAEPTIEALASQPG